MSLNYRADIQILRGISVLLVVLFHLGIFGFSSGFLGVDVFFVISGFLMASLYNPNNKLTFLSRRAKRLLPAYFATIFTTLIISLLITIPPDFQQVKVQTNFALLFSSNIGFWLQNSYFSKAEFNPLLHLWSLGVEIQFYLFIPLIYFIVHKFKYSLPILLVSSLVCCFIIVGISPKTSFFMTPLRLWEFLIGFGVAKFSTSFLIHKKHAAWGGVAFGLIIIIPFFPINNDSLNFATGHPGLLALAISLATAIVLAFGLPNWMINNKISNCLVLLGEYSYSIYLAHFPVIVLFLYQPFSGTILNTKNTIEFIYILGLIAFFSLILYKFIETPFRKKTISLVPVFIMAVIILVVNLISAPLNNSRFTKNEFNIFNAWTDRDEYRCGKIFRFFNPTSKVCNLTNLKSPTKKLLLVGNSHADSIKYTFKNEAAKQNMDVYFVVSNDPLMNNKFDVNLTLKLAVENGINNIVVHYSPRGLKLNTLEELIIKSKKLNIDVAFIMPVPTWESHIPKTLHAHFTHQQPLEIKNIDNYLVENKSLISFIQLNKSPNFKNYEVVEYFCDKQLCAMTDEEYKPLYFDSGHLTLTGSAKLSQVFIKVLNDISVN